MPRPALTLLLVTHDGVARADFARGDEPSAWWNESAAAADDPWALEPLLDLAPPARRVWVLSDSAWTQTLTLAAGATAGLSRPDLERALAFETEPLSGVPAARSVLAAVPLGAGAGPRSYWVCQVTEDVLARCAAAVRRSGGRLAGVLHPGGIGEPLEVPSSGPRQRVEVWPDVVVAAFGAPGKNTLIMMLNTDPRGERWAGPVGERFRERPAKLRETRLLDGTLVVSGRDGLADEVEEAADANARLAAAWAARLRGGAVAVPVVRPAGRSAAPLVRGLVGAVLFAAAAAGAAWHHSVVSEPLPEYAKDTAAFQEQTAQLGRLRDQRKKLDAEKVELAKAAEPLAAKLAFCEEALVSHRRRVSDLVRVLGEVRPADVVVRKLELEGADPKVKGLALSPQGANAFAASLDDRLRPLSWRVLPPRRTAQHKLDDGGPWEFEIRVEDPTRPGARGTPRGGD